MHPVPAAVAALLLAFAEPASEPAGDAQTGPPGPAATAPAGDEPAAPGDGSPPRDGEAAEGRKPGKDQDGDGKEDNWVDVGHAFVEQRIFAPILRLDRFFSDERDLDAERSRSFLRWRNQVYFTEDASGATFTTGLHASLRLPGLNQQLRRLRIVIAGETRDALQTLFPRRGTSSIPDEDDGLGAANAGVRFYFLDTLFSHADLGAGVLARLPPGLFGRLRFRTAIPVKRLFLTRGVVTGFWRTDTRFGTSAGLELERPVTATVVTRLSGTATLTEVSRGVEWVSELAAFTQIDEHSAAQIALAVNGATRPGLAADGITRRPDLDRFRVYTRLRRDVFRRWIFLEIEPELASSWTPEEKRHPAWGLTFRVELQFQGKEAPPPPPPEEPPEPADPAPADALPIRPTPR